jgi:hypothetical protein
VKKILNSEKLRNDLYNSQGIRKKRSWLEEALKEFDKIECEDIEIRLSQFDHSFFSVRVITWEYVAVVRIISRNFFTYDLKLTGGSRTSETRNTLREICDVLLQNSIDQ